MGSYTKMVIVTVSFLAGFFGPLLSLPTAAERSDRIYITDRTGEKWDITQAASIGFEPEKFQYGLGRNAFTPLNDQKLSSDMRSVPSNLRVLGTAHKNKARAYSIPKLSRHEIANTAIADTPIVAGY